MFRHVVMFRWREDADPAAVEAALAELARLPARVEGVRAFSVGTDAGLAEGNFDCAVVADFDDADGYLAYRDHPVHVALVRERVAPLLAERAAVQHEGH